MTSNISTLLSKHMNNMALKIYNLFCTCRQESNKHGLSKNGDIDLSIYVFLIKFKLLYIGCTYIYQNLQLRV